MYTTPGGPTLGVEGEHAALVAAKQHDGRHVSRQCVDPRHVQARRTRSFSRHWKSPGKNKMCVSKIH